MDAIDELLRPASRRSVCTGESIRSDHKEHTMSTSRVQLALNVTDIEAATAFYTRLFGVEPNKRREGYANFAVAEPPLKLVLIENPGAAGALNHLGVELANTDDVAAIASRFFDVGLEIRSAEQEKCCHAVQEKVYVTAPEVPLDQWEFYAVLDDNPDDDGVDDADTCCPTSQTEDSPCCT
jgi:catechol 2,3-dioxygenase-like lactoylglutathione lyase family enzyme